MRRWLERFLPGRNLPYRVLRELHDTVIATSDDAGRVALSVLRGLAYERMLILAIDDADRVIGAWMMGEGKSRYHVKWSTQDVFRLLLGTPGAREFFMAHNHPSGNPEFSTQDRLMTEAYATAGEVLGIVMRDHILVHGDSFQSAKLQHLV